MKGIYYIIYHSIGIRYYNNYKIAFRLLSIAEGRNILIDLTKLFLLLLFKFYY